MHIVDGTYVVFQTPVSEAAEHERKVESRCATHVSYKYYHVDDVFLEDSCTCSSYADCYAATFVIDTLEGLTRGDELIRRPST